jgi:hypothetical protein
MIAVAEELFVENRYASGKLQKAKEILKKAYNESSDFKELVEVKDAALDEIDLQMLYFRHQIPVEWFTRTDVVIDVVFQQFGANLAFSETHYLVDRIFSEPTIPKVDIEENIQKDVISNIEEFSNANELNALLAPISQYVDMHTKWLTDFPDKVQMDVRTGNLSFGNKTPKILWSNKYMPFDDFALVDKKFAQWILKPSFDERLTIKVSKTENEDNLDLLFYVNLNFNIVNAEKALVLRTQKPYIMI